MESTMEKWDIIKYHLRQKKTPSRKLNNSTNVNQQSSQIEEKPRKISYNNKMKSIGKNKVIKQTKEAENSLHEINSLRKENSKLKQENKDQKNFQKIIKSLKSELNEINKSVESSKISVECIRKEMEDLNTVINEKNKLIIELKMELQRMEMDKNEYIRLLEWDIQDLREKLEKLKLNKWISVAVDSLDEFKIMREYVMQNPHLLQVTTVSSNSILSELDFSQNMELTKDITNASVERTMEDVCNERLDELSEELDEPSEGLDEQSEELDEPSEELDEPSEELDEPSEELDEPSEELGEPSEGLDEPSKGLGGSSEGLGGSSEGLDVDFSDFFENNFVTADQLKENTDNSSPNIVSKDSDEGFIDFSDFYEDLFKNCIIDETLLKDLNSSHNINAYGKNINNNEKYNVISLLVDTKKSISNKTSSVQSTTNIHSIINTVADCNKNSKQNNYVTETEIDIDFSEFFQDISVDSSNNGEVQSVCHKSETVVFNRNTNSTIQDECTKNSFIHTDDTFCQDKEYLSKRHVSKTSKSENEDLYIFDSRKELMKRGQDEQTFCSSTDEATREPKTKKKKRFTLFK